MIDAVLTGIQNAVNQVKIDPYWELTAFVGEAVFGGRFILQWIMSEKKKQSYIPDFFWYMSIVGSMILLAYFVHKQSLAMIIAFSLQILIYGRNLHLIKRTPKPAVEQADKKHWGIDESNQGDKK